MAMPVTVALVLAISSSTAATATSTAPWTVILICGSVVAALTGIWKLLHLGELLHGTRNFLKDYNGEPARPGAAAVPGMPARLQKIEAQTHEIKGALPSLATALDALKAWAEENGDRINLVDSKLTQTDARISDHARRNEETARLLRDEVARQAADIEQKLRVRNGAVDKRLESLSQDLLRAESYRAALVELGIPIAEPGSGTHG